jgi:2-polyprenyl-6-hydroxyphenyl methylase/3-demethylubiquinone-9 3-methyltransferase
MRCVKPQGLLFIALYNDEGFISKYWWAVKRMHNRFTWTQWPLRIIYTPYFVGFGWIVNQFRFLSGKRTRRGMTLWYDMVDWLGGYPFEVVSPKKMNEYAGEHGFELINKYYIGLGLGCNEFVYRRNN